MLVDEAGDHAQAARIDMPLARQAHASGSGFDGQRPAASRDEVALPERLRIVNLAAFDRQNAAHRCVNALQDFRTVIAQ